MSTWSPSTPPNTQLDQLSEDASVDVLVIGAGGAGMSSALFAALQGARVLLVESTDYLGGTTALSAGTSWVPGTAKGLAVEPGDTPERAKTFLNHAVGDKADAALRNAFVDHGAKAVATLEAHTEVQYQVRTLHPDYLSELEADSPADS
jgi:succinate dehydrogenase/fumarate reductase flavoprotein subunit